MDLYDVIRQLVSHGAARNPAELGEMLAAVDEAQNPTPAAPEPAPDPAPVAPGPVAAPGPAPAPAAPAFQADPIGVIGQ